MPSSGWSIWKYQLYHNSISAHFSYVDDSFAWILQVRFDGKLKNLIRIESRKFQLLNYFLPWPEIFYPVLTFDDWPTTQRLNEWFDWFQTSFFNGFWKRSKSNEIRCSVDNKLLNLRPYKPGKAFCCIRLAWCLRSLWICWVFHWVLCSVDLLSRLKRRTMSYLPVYL